MHLALLAALLPARAVAAATEELRGSDIAYLEFRLHVKVEKYSLGITTLEDT
jgi:hypothetical protein